jgi:hypothetical protein
MFVVMMMRVMMMHRLRRPHGGSGEGGREGERAQRGLQFGTIHQESSF